MRSAKAQDYWKKVYKKTHNNSFSEIDLLGLNGINKIQCNSGILAICGLNGAGKSTIVSAVKAIIGMPLLVKDENKIQGTKVQGTFVLNGSSISCSNVASERLVDNSFDISKIKYMDFESSTKIQNYMITQTNLDELLPQYEEYELSEDELNSINYIVGKDYQLCGIREFDGADVDSYDEEIPFFRVVVDDEEYTSINMGTGEHFLLYLFWCINRAEKGTILLIEEPETFIGIASQCNFANFLAQNIVTNDVQVILTTHSPYILKNIKNESVRVVSRYRNQVTINTPPDELSVEQFLGIDYQQKGIFFVEDRVAADLLTIIINDRLPYLLKEFDIESVAGEGNITTRLKFPHSDKMRYQFVGVYDGDMRNQLDTEGINWKYCFLPGDDAPETMFHKFLNDKESIQRFSQCIDKPTETVLMVLSMCQGYDPHDWFEEIRKKIAIDGKFLVEAFYRTFMCDKPFVDDFVSDLRECIDG